MPTEQEQVTVPGEEYIPPSKQLAPSGKKKSRGWLYILLVLIAAVVAYRWWWLPREQSAQAANKKAEKNANAAIPVVAAPARRGEMPVYLNGLGTVTPLNTVTVHTRVDGELISVNYTEGQLVKQGDLLVEIDPRPFQVQLEQAEGQMTKDQATLANAKVDLTRYQNLLDQGAVPKQQYDTQAATVKQLDATIESDQAAIDNAKLQLTYSRITAPIGGRIGLRLVDRGNIVHASDTNGLAVITQLDPITVIFTLAEDDLRTVMPKVRAGTKLPVLAYDRDLKRKLAEGMLLTVDNQVDPTTGTVKLKATFDNAENILFPNEFVNARLLADTHRGVVLAPTAAIQRSPQGTFVYVVKPDGTVEVRNVTDSITEGENTQIDQGLQPGEQVVIEGVDKLQEGSRVTVHQSDGNHGQPPQTQTSQP